MKIISLFLAFLLVFQAPFQLKVKAEEMDETSAIALPAVGLTASAVSGIATKYVGTATVGQYVKGAFDVLSAGLLIYGFIQEVFGKDEELGTYYYDCIFDESITNISIENFYAEGYDLTLYNNLLLGGEFPENTSGNSLTVGNGFDTWRAVPSGIFDIWANEESEDIMNDSTIGYPTVQLLDPGSLNIRFYNDTYSTTTPNGIYNGFKSYFASGIFMPKTDGTLNVSKYYTSQTINTSQSLNVGLISSSIYLSHDLYLLEYDGIYYEREDTNFLNVTSNPYWKIHTTYSNISSTSLSFANLKADSYYCLVYSPYFSNQSSTHKGRILSHQYISPSLSFSSYNGLSSSNNPEIALGSQSQNDIFQNYVKTEYNNYYVAGDWYEGDNNSGGSSGDSSGSGSSGSSSVDGEIDVNVSGDLNGSIDHSGNVDININLPGMGGGTTEEEYEYNKFTFENLIMKFLNFLLDCLLSILGIAFSPFLAFFEMIAEKFQELIHVQIYELFASVFSFLPEEILTTITFAFSILMLLGIIRFFI